MDFSQLPAIPKMKIMKMLSIGSRYNFSLVFPEMEGDVRRSIPPVLPFLSKELGFGLTIIDSLSDLESAGVLASIGYLESKRYLELRDLDVKNVPSNILSSLTRVVSGLHSQLIIRRVAGLELSLLGNLNCENLHLSFLSIPTPLVTQAIKVRFCGLREITGNLRGLLDSITCDTLDLDLNLDDDEFDEATCDSLSKMLPRRVRKLELGFTSNYWKRQSLILDLLAKYDGMGSCNEITIYGVTYSTDFEENLAFWTTSKGWTVVNSFGWAGLFQIKLKRAY